MFKILEHLPYVPFITRAGTFGYFIFHPYFFLYGMLRETKLFLWLA